jgi:hypothetical protein
LFPYGGGGIELAASSGWSRVLGIDAVGGAPDCDFADEGGARVASRRCPGWLAVSLTGAILNLASVRRRRSGRWQARYQGPDGLTRSAPRTFDSKRSAEQWLTLMEGRILRGEWQSPEQSKMMFGGYATHWVVDRRLEPRSRELYAMLLRLHIMPWFGDLALDRITLPMVRSWRTDLLRQGRSESTAAKSYRLLRAILNTAVKDDRLLGENPCRMRGSTRSRHRSGRRRQ